MAKKNPLDEVIEPEENLTLNKVFRNAPDTVTDQEVDAVIKRLRENRARFIQAEGKAVRDDDEGTGSGLSD